MVPMQPFEKLPHLSDTTDFAGGPGVSSPSKSNPLRGFPNIRDAVWWILQEGLH